jgi:hypothetical protein
MLYVRYFINLQIVFYDLFDLVQKNALNQSLKQIRSEKDELFLSNQKLRQEKLAAEVCFYLFYFLHINKFLGRKKCQYNSCNYP